LDILIYLGHSKIKDSWVIAGVFYINDKPHIRSKKYDSKIDKYTAEEFFLAYIGENLLKYFNIDYLCISVYNHCIEEIDFLYGIDSFDIKLKGNNNKHKKHIIKHIKNEYKKTYKKHKKVGKMKKKTR
jgi:hypothetical protein